MHGGAHGSGAPRGNRNALKTGWHTKEAIAERRLGRQVTREARRLMWEIEHGLEIAPEKMFDELARRVNLKVLDLANYATSGFSR